MEYTSEILLKKTKKVIYMLFCPKCGAILKAKMNKNKTVKFCGCGFSTEAKEEASIKEKVESKQEEIAVMEKEAEIYPVVDSDCPKCGHDKAHYWTKQMRAGDEPETKFFRCEKCKHTWRDQS